MKTCLLTITIYLFLISTFSCNHNQTSKIFSYELCLDTIFRVPNSGIGCEKIIYKARISDKSRLNRIQKSDFKTCVISDIYPNRPDTISDFDLSYELDKNESFLLLTIISNRMAGRSKEESEIFCAKLESITRISMLGNDDTLFIEPCFNEASGIQVHPISKTFITKKQ